ncbi:uncharacterized protein N7446_008500 [Penicillium canescens]|uniref:Uncharacterized protein n=1 Tax=Penicillium canescens TaxID=5083 RepID=A0AAD6IPD5_PENCN|nr:uncharacterized protein N7446_008500 [Penicillium canescens]KAJ6057602.1 hypothetical protein N7460_000876 [Penicillium canescens]KAJ6058917.1 hypothetical protein N7446_008500 [Penicillium canescens]
MSSLVCMVALHPLSYKIIRKTQLVSKKLNSVRHIDHVKDTRSQRTTAKTKVEFFFYDNQKPRDEETLRAITHLAYHAASSLKICPRAIFVRSGVHCTTRSKTGFFVKDPAGSHITLNIKSRHAWHGKYSFTAHAYVGSDQDWTLTWATNSRQKPDQTDWQDIPGVFSMLVKKDEFQ